MSILFDAIIDTRGVAVAWAGARGVAKATLARPEALEAESLYLGVGEGPSVSPVLLRDGGDIGVAYVDSRGVCAAVFGKDRLLFDGGGNVAACTAGSSAVVATSDGTGVHAVALDAGGEERRYRLSSRNDAQSLCIAACGASVLAFFVVDGALVVVRLNLASGDVKEVTHPLRETATQLAVGGTHSRVAVAVAYGSDHVDLGVFDVDGAARERVHPALFGQSDLSFPRVSWVKTAFIVSAWEASSERVLVKADGQEIPPFTEVASPFYLAGFSEELYCVEVRADADGHAELHVQVRGADLSTRRKPVSVEPPALPLRELQLRGREFMRALAAKQVAGGYRGGATGSVDVNAMRGELHGQSSPVTFSIEAKATLQVHVEVCIGELGEEESISLWRLAAWVRDRWSPSSRARAASDLEWAEGVTGEKVQGVDRSGALLRVHLRLDGYPSPDVFTAWLRELAGGPEA